ncbi:MAG: LbtU family siderophore porin [Legionellales bacterium]|nr:LbtU family siderophore porin [Legionellales bacterium]
MKPHFFLLMFLGFFSHLVFAKPVEELQRQVEQLQQQTMALQAQLNQLQKQLVSQSVHKKSKSLPKNKIRQSMPSRERSSISSLPKPSRQKKPSASLTKSSSASAKFHSSPITVHRPDAAPESMAFYPTALVADEHVISYIAGVPVVTSPYLGSRPAFDGSDYIVNISSINRDIRLLQQRRGLYRAYGSLGYPGPNQPIIAVSGKVEPIASVGDPWVRERSGDLSLGTSELDIAAILNKNVEAYMSLAFDSAPPGTGGQRLSNSSIDLNMGFVNIGNLDKTPLYFTGGQLFVPFGRFSSAMVSAPLTMILARTKSRPFILGYKSQKDSGPFAAVYGFRSDTTLGSCASGGVNAGYMFVSEHATAEVGASIISGIDDADGLQFSGSSSGTTFGGFSSITNGSEAVRKIPAAGVHGSLSIDRYNFTAEWVGTTGRFRTQDLSMNGQGARPQAGQLEAGVTFIMFKKPSSFTLGYQWSKETLALNMPSQRFAGVFNISIWKDTVESLEYRHDRYFPQNQYANGASPVGVTNANTISPGGASDTLLAQIGVYF